MCPGIGVNLVPKVALYLEKEKRLLIFPLKFQNSRNNQIFMMPYLKITNIYQKVKHALLIKINFSFKNESHFNMVQSRSELWYIVLTSDWKLISDLKLRNSKQAHRKYKCMEMFIDPLTYVQLAFIILAGIAAGCYFLFLCYMIFCVMKTINSKKASLPSMSQLRRRYYLVRTSESFYFLKNMIKAKLFIKHSFYFFIAENALLCYIEYNAFTALSIRIF